MEASIDLWIEYILRFSHLVAGISWIGSSFYFIWLDSSFEPPEEARHNVEGEVFMVHGGFYYQVDKKKIAPGELPKTLHWFKWEATLTFITGFLLFFYLYFLGGASLLIDKQVMDLNQWQAILMSLGLISGVWFLYDQIYHPRFLKHMTISNFIALPLALLLIYGSFLIFSGRGAFMIVGVIFGSSMLFNVWVRILPGQKRMLTAAENGETPDYSESAKSKSRSVHNTYFIFPVLFIMLSNHYPAVYNHEYNWLLLMILTVSGAMVRRVMVTKNTMERWLLVPAAIGMLALVFITAKAPKLAQVVDELNYEKAAKIVEQRCHSCHSTNNTDEFFKTPQKGIVLETQAQLRQHREKLIQQVEGKVMPLGNKTQMTEKERAYLVEYLRQLK
jgi:uncharacterized membrane protein